MRKKKKKYSKQRVSQNKEKERENKKYDRENEDERKVHFHCVLFSFKMFRKVYFQTQMMSSLQK